MAISTVVGQSLISFDDAVDSWWENSVLIDPLVAKTRNWLNTKTGKSTNELNTFFFLFLSISNNQVPLPPPPPHLLLLSPTQHTCI